MSPEQVAELLANQRKAARKAAPMPGRPALRVSEADPGRGGLPPSVSFWAPLPPSWNRVFKARAIPTGRPGKVLWTAQVYKSREAKEYTEAVAAAATRAGVTCYPRAVMLEFSAVVTMERAGCDLDDRLKVYFDALNGVLFEDDEQVARYREVVRLVDSGAPGVQATFTPIPVDRYGRGL